MELAVEKDRTLEVEIERLLPGGVGLAHAEGLTLFVSLAAPGDVLRIRIDRIQGKVGFASLVEIIKPSPARIEPPCPYFGRCGGCDFQQLTYEAQLEAKVEIIRDCLHRIAKIEVPMDIRIHRSSEWRYRARAMWQVDAPAIGLGYFERASNRVCDVEYCAVLVPELQQTLEQVRNAFHAQTTPPQLREIETVVGDEGISVAPEIASFKTQIVSRVIGNETYHFSADSFFQINHELLEPLIAEALRDIQTHETEDGKGRSAIDLYCGVGLFTLPLARRFARVVGIEGNPHATEFAQRNLEFAKRVSRLSEPPALEGGRGDSRQEQTAGAGRSSATVGGGAELSGRADRGGSPTVREGEEPGPLGSTQIVTARVADWLKQHSPSFGPVDFLLLDPPRSGCENAVIAGILALRPRQISYVSCDPATLARDIKKLVAGGYTLDSIAAFDMFPQTHHVETVVRLSANGL